MIKRLISLALCSFLIVSASAFTTFATGIGLSDIDENHWAYDAIFELVLNKTVNGYPDGTFKPNGTVTFAEFEKMITGVWTDNPVQIDREAALELLWEHSGKPENYFAPGIITKQMKNANAVAWGYSTGLMQGNDGLNLRPDDTLTRAEAATLIVRSRKDNPDAKSFANAVSSDILKLVWDVYDVFEGEYIPEDTVSPDELYAATKKLSGISTLSLDVTTATVEDTALLLAYASVMQTHLPAVAKSIENVSNKYGKIAQISAAYCFENGVVFPNDASAIATKRDVALLLLQLDDFNGKKGVKISKDLSTYPANADDFAFITMGTPAAVYTTAYDIPAKPVDIFNFADAYSSIFTTFLTEMEGKFSNKVDFTYNPSLVCQNSKEAILRVKCTMNEGNASEVFGEGFENAEKSFYVDIHTGDPVANIYIPIENAKIGKFICNSK